MMKKTLLASVITLAGFAAFNTTEAAPVAWNTSGGDVFLAFESTSLSKDYLVDLGQGSILATAISSGSFSPVDLSADLSTVFGSDWATNSTSNVQYGLFGLPSSKTIVYASVASGNAALVKKAAVALSTTSSDYKTLGSAYNTDIGSGQGLTVGVEQLVGTSPDTGLTSTWIGNTTTAPYFGVYNASLVNGVAGNLDVYGTTGSASTLEGTLTLSSAGLLSVVAVPEPSTYALCGLGALFLVIVARRRRLDAAQD
jgi:hypothetical protein